MLALQQGTLPLHGARRAGGPRPGLGVFQRRCQRLTRDRAQPCVLAAAAAAPAGGNNSGDDSGPAANATPRPDLKAMGDQTAQSMEELERRLLLAERALQVGAGPPCLHTSELFGRGSTGGWLASPAVTPAGTPPLFPVALCAAAGCAAARRSAGPVPSGGAQAGRDRKQPLRLCPAAINRGGVARQERVRC